MQMSGELHASAALLQERTAGTHCTGDWLGPRPDLDGSEKT